MAKQVPKENNNAEELTLSEMLGESVAHPPRLVVMGTDSTGVEKSAEIIMDYFQNVPTHELREKYMQELGQVVASQKPYIAQVKEVHFWKKKILDLTKEGYGKAAEVVVVYGFNVPEATKGTHGFLLVKKNQGKMQVQNIDSPELERDADQSQIIGEILIFLLSYGRHKPLT